MNTDAPGMAGAPLRPRRVRRPTAAPIEAPARDGDNGSAIPADSGSNVPSAATPALSGGRAANGVAGSLPERPLRQVVSGFTELLLSEPVADAVRAMGYERPTEIQERVIPLLLDGRDVIGQAQTGTGKTAAFGIPLVQMLDPSLRGVQALVLAPTRELALQIAGEMQKLIGFMPTIGIATIYGGAGYQRQLDDLRAGAQVVVGTPGRVLDHIGRGTLKIEAVRYLILDEADRMLDMGFLPDVERILRRTPRTRQTALFSATMPTVIRILSRRYMRNAATVHVQAQDATVPEVDQTYYEVADRDKLKGLLSLLEIDPPERAMLFRRTRDGVDRLVDQLRRAGVRAAAIHGDMRQSAREQVLQQFRDGSLAFLVATDVASRGLDVPEVSHVFNYDVPEEGEAYVHRIGRTARAGRRGSAITFVGEWDTDKLAPIQKVVGDRLQRRILPIYQR